MHASRSLVLALISVSVSVSGPALAQDFADDLVQAPSLKAPERGSVIGSFASMSLAPGDLYRGTYTIPSPFEAPAANGYEPEATVLPSYSPESGISEWGMGWSTSLAITRAPLVGDVDYTSGEFMSPWGRLATGTDGYFYPQGLSPRIRLQQTTAGWIAVSPDGTRHSFTQTLTGRYGTYAWYLTSVESPFGDKTSLVYFTNDSGRPFVKEVMYGDREHTDANRIVFEYRVFSDGLDDPSFVDFRANRKVVLDRAIRGVRFEARSGRLGAYSLLWRYDLTHQRHPRGPALFLTAVTKRYVSGATEPPISYAYDFGEGVVTTQHLDHLDLLDEYLAMNGGDAVHPSNATYFDVDRDGRIDIEDSYAQDQLRRDDHGWAMTSLPRPTDVDTRCRPAPSTTNVPRTLARMTGSSAEPESLSLAHRSNLQTTLVVCNFLGQKQYERFFDGNWELGSTTRLVDINQDLRPDFIHIDRGSYRAIPNLSTAGAYRFGNEVRGQLSPAIDADTAWLEDMNGDQIADIVARAGGRLFVWHGTGRFQFESQAVLLQFRSVNNTIIQNLAAFSVTFLHANKDGLTDVLLTRPDRGEGYIYFSDGNVLRGVAIPALVSLRNGMSPPIFADLSGSGEEQLVFTEGQLAYALSLTAPQTDLLVVADDGKGGRFELSYDRATPTPGIFSRPTVLAELTSLAAGLDDVSTVYAYEDPVLHSQTHQLLGFATTRSVAPLLSEEIRFHHDDEVSGVVIGTLRTDLRTTDFYEFRDIVHQEALFNGVRWLRVANDTVGLRSYDGAQQASTTTRYLAYEATYCPSIVEVQSSHGVLRRETTRDTPAALAGSSTIPGALHCLTADERLQGLHAGAILDFTAEQKLKRNPRGQILTVEHVAPEGTLLRQTNTYDAMGRLLEVRTPEAGSTLVAYDPQTGELASIRAPDGVLLEVDGRSAVDRTMRELVQHRGGNNPFTRHFRYDDFLRLAKSWDSFRGGSEAQPLEQLHYAFPTAETLGAVYARTVVDTAGAAVETASWIAADGAELAKGTLVPYEGTSQWVMPSIVQPSRGDLTTTTWLPDRYGGAWNSAAAGTLAAGAKKVASEFLDGSQRPHASDHLLQGPRDLGDQTMEEIHRVADRTYRVSATGVTTETRVAENAAWTSFATTDLSGNLTSSTNEAGDTTAFTYDTAGRLRRVTLPDGTSHSVSFDGFGRPERIERQQLGRIDFAYEPDTGRLTRKQFFGEGAATATREVAYDYDDIGRLQRARHRDLASNELIHYEYDYDGADGSGQLGHLTSLTGPSYQRQITYNPDETVKQVAVTLGTWRRVETSYLYNAAGNVINEKRTIYNATTGAVIQSSVFATQHDSSGRLNRILLNNKELATLTYDAFGRVSQATLDSTSPHGGNTLVPLYDETTRARSGYWTDASQWNAGVEWFFDKRGLTDFEHLTLNDAKTRRDYAYDERAFLIETAAPGQLDTYAYDSNGLITAISDEKGARTISTGRQRVIGGVQYNYDSLGRLVEKGELALTYGPNGHLAKATKAGEQWNFVYDEAGNRVLKLRGTTPVAGYLDGLYLDATSVIEPVRIAGVLVGVLVNNTFQMLTTDPRGSIWVEQDGAQNIPSAYGIRARHPSIAPALDYVEKGYDPDLGLVRMGVRDYDPFTSQFITPDPLYFEQLGKCAESPIECNLYGYALNNPLLYGDPTGEGAEWIGRMVNGLLDLVSEGLVSTANAPTKTNPTTYARLSTADFAATIAINATGGKVAGRFGGYVFGKLRGAIGNLTARPATRGAAELVERAAARGVQANRIAGQVAENFLARVYGGANQVTRQTSIGLRVIDNLASGIARESKVGRTALTNRVRSQIAKDAELLASPRSGVTGVEWHFFPSRTGTGPTAPLRRALEEAGIGIVIH